MADTGCEIVPVTTGDFLMKVMEMKNNQYRLYIYSKQHSK